MKNRHNLSHYRLATLDLGKLVPVGCVEILPGDFFRHRSNCLLRVQPLLKPVMHMVDVRIHHFFVPIRLLWDEFEDFITRKNAELTAPVIEYTGGGTYDLLDHLGVPDVTRDINALPVRAYNLIYNDYYRDQDLTTEVDLDDLDLKTVCWQKDRFTSARSNPQLGAASVNIPFSSGTEAPVTGRGGRVGIVGQASDNFYNANTTVTIGGIDPNKTETPNTDQVSWDPTNTGSLSTSEVTGAQRWTLDADLEAGLVADLSAAVGGGIDVNDLRQALAQQMFLEHRNRYGSRYEDYLNFLGITPDDARLQNPQYLGGGKNTVSFSEVLATAVSTGVPVGDLSGHGISVLNTRPYRRFFKEHGFVMSLMSIRPRTIYSQSLPKMFLRSTSWDYWQKELEMMGPEEVYTVEPYGLHPNTTDVFGYNGRHDSYRHLPSYVSGEYRDGGSEEDWHYARDFSSSPALNTSFVECVPTDRVYADTATPELYTMVSHQIKAKRILRKVAKH